MSPEPRSRGGNMAAPSNLYTVILALALAAVAAVAIFVAYKCYVQYDTIFGGV